MTLDNGEFGNAALVLDRTILHAALVRMAAAAHFVLDAGCRVREWSPGAEVLLGWSRKDALGSSFAQRALQPDVARRLQSEVDACVRCGRSNWLTTPRRVELQLDGAQPLVAELCMGPVQAGADWLFVGVLRDLTETVAIEQQLVQSQKMDAIGQLAGTLAHDFNNLLGMVLGSLDLLGLDLPADSKYLQIARGAGQRAVDVTRALMTVARRAPLNRATCDCRQTLLELIPLFEQSLGAGVVLEVVVPEGLPALHVNLSAFNNALLNLVLNAHDALPLGGRVILYAYAHEVAEDMGSLGFGLEPGHYVVIGVDDDGTGMDEATRARAFEPFFTTKGPGRGTGLGLAMVYGFCRQAGGTARLESTPGRGTSVQLILPAMVQPLAPSVDSAHST